MAAINYAKMQSKAWYGDERITLRFPEGWEVNTVTPQDAPKLTATEIEEALSLPIGTPRISEIAAGRKNAVIVVDDLSRPTPVAEIIPFLLRELRDIPKDEIRFVVGGGSHRALTPEEIAKKVGANIAREYQVTCHDFMSGDLRGFGNLPSGMPIY